MSVMHCFHVDATGNVCWERMRVAILFLQALICWAAAAAAAAAAVAIESTDVTRAL